MYSHLHSRYSLLLLLPVLFLSTACSGSNLLGSKTKADKARETHAGVALGLAIANAPKGAQDIRIHQATVFGTLDQPGVVSIRGIADSDPAPTAFSIIIPLPGEDQGSNVGTRTVNLDLKVDLSLAPLEVVLDP